MKKTGIITASAVACLLAHGAAAQSMGSGGGSCPLHDGDPNSWEITTWTTPAPPTRGAHCQYPPTPASQNGNWVGTGGGTVNVVTNQGAGCSPYYCDGPLNTGGGSGSGVTCPSVAGSCTWDMEMPNGTLPSLTSTITVIDPACAAFEQCLSNLSLMQLGGDWTNGPTAPPTNGFCQYINIDQGESLSNNACIYGAVGVR
jgi:hypothetical protein